MPLCANDYKNLDVTFHRIPGLLRGVHLSDLHEKSLPEQFIDVDFHPRSRGQLLLLPALLNLDCKSLNHELNHQTCSELLTKSPHGLTTNLLVQFSFFVCILQ